MENFRPAYERLLKKKDDSAFLAVFDIQRALKVGTELTGRKSEIFVEK